MPSRCRACGDPRVPPSNSSPASDRGRQVNCWRDQEPRVPVPHRILICPLCDGVEADPRVAETVEGEVILAACCRPGVGDSCVERVRSVLHPCTLSGFRTRPRPAGRLLNAASGSGTVRCSTPHTRGAGPDRLRVRLRPRRPRGRERDRGCGRDIPSHEVSRPSASRAFTTNSNDDAGSIRRRVSVQPAGFLVRSSRSPWRPCWTRA